MLFDNEQQRPGSYRNPLAADAKYLPMSSEALATEASNVRGSAVVMRIFSAGVQAASVAPGMLGWALKALSGIFMEQKAQELDEAAKTYDELSRLSAVAEARRQAEEAARVKREEANARIFEAHLKETLERDRERAAKGERSNWVDYEKGGWSEHVA